MSLPVVIKGELCRQKFKWKQDQLDMAPYWMQKARKIGKKREPERKRERERREAKETMVLRKINKKSEEEGETDLNVSGK